MPACQQRHQHPLQEMILADHHLLHFIEKMLQSRMRAAAVITSPSLKRIVSHRSRGILDRHGKGHAGKDMCR
jgi:hypothetical protein